MQTQKRNNARHVQSTGYRSRSVTASQQARSSLLLIAALCVLLPPLGLVILWRSDRTSQLSRLLLSLLSTALMTVLFALSMRTHTPTDVGIRPAPMIPTTVGYGAPLPAQNADSVGAPAQPDGSVPAAPSGQSEPQVDPSTEPAIEPGGGEMGAETTVYAVTNNATNYHLYEICDTQTNNRVLTLQQALDEGLTPCEKCVGAAG